MATQHRQFPVSMEDEELFPRKKYGISKHQKFSERAFEEMYGALDKMWWSRLVTAVRGYISNDFREDEELVFVFDDVFIYVHRALVEGTKEDGARLLRDMETLEGEGTDALRALEDGFQLPPDRDPFRNPPTKPAYTRLFGQPSRATYSKAFKQGFCYIVLLNIYAKLQERWTGEAREKGKKKGVSFQEDGEWQPDSRVVLFQELFPGNRTWVLTDFDRHLLYFWRPHGVKVIFGERYLQTKLREGFRLCAYCGLVESVLRQFPPCPKCAALRRPHPPHYCSPDCQHMDADNHKHQHRT